ncbi:MAG: hypothetical protein ABSF26_16110 [Thermoguttaceae bacterium]|jgi:hypothetical protein
MRKTVLMLLAGALLLGAGVFRPAATAAEPDKVLAVVAGPSYEELLSDAGFVGKLIDRPQLGSLLEGLVAMATQGKGLTGIDKSRPCGIVVAAEGSDSDTAAPGKVSGYAFLPVTDLKQVLDVLEPYVSAEQTGGGVYKLSPKDGKKPVYVKAAGGWAFGSDKPEGLAHVAADPLALLGGLEKPYVVAARIFVANLPAQYREQFLAQMKKGAHENNQQRKPDESEQAFAARLKIIGQIIGMVEGVVNDLDQISLGWGLDRGAEKTFLDLSITARPGTPTAGQFTSLSALTSKFQGFRLPGAALAMNFAGTLSAAKIEILGAVVDQAQAAGMKEAEKKNQPGEKLDQVKQVVSDLAELVRKTVRSGRCDGAVTVLLDPAAATGLAGLYVADGALLDKALKTLADMAIADNPGVAQLVKLDADRAQSVRLHTVSIPIGPETDNRDKIVGAIGETLDIVIGVGPDSAYLAAGRDALATLKRAIGASATASGVPILDLALAGEPVARFMAAVAKPKDQPPAALAASELKKTPGKDHINFVARPIANGVQYHLEVEQGIIHSAARLITAGQRHGH